MRILVCDDERAIARLVQANLQGRGHEVVCVFDGRQAIERLEAESFDRAYLDVVMPHMDGFEVLAWIRTHERTKDLPVILLTTQAQAMRDRIDEIPYRVDGVISKPFDNAELL